MADLGVLVVGGGLSRAWVASARRRAISPAAWPSSMPPPPVVMSGGSWRAQMSTMASMSAGCAVKVDDDHRPGPRAPADAVGGGLLFRDFYDVDHAIRRLGFRVQGPELV